MFSSNVLFSLKVKHSPLLGNPLAFNHGPCPKGWGRGISTNQSSKVQMPRGWPMGGKLKIDGCTTLVALSTVLETDALS